MNSIKKIIFMPLFLFLVISFYSVEFPLSLSKKDYSKGPLFGKNMYVPFLIHYNFDSLSAKSGKKFDFQYHISTYYGNDEKYKFENIYFWDPTVRLYNKADIIVDYESYVNELGFSFNILDKLQVGINMRICAYYGGFLDPYIEGFHYALGFPNGGREYFLQNRCYINIPNDNGPDIYLDKTTVAFGDIDLWVKYTFFENRYVSLAGLGAFKIPTGRLKTLSGSDYPDIAFGILGDFRPTWFITFYMQGGLVIPFNLVSYYPMFNGLIGLEVNPLSFFSIVGQMNIKTSPISNDIEWSWNPNFGTDFKKYSLPQTNILVGVIFKHKGFKWQFFIEEDAITNQGIDIAFNFTFSHTFSLNPMKINI